MGRRHKHRESRRKLDGNLCDITVKRLLEVCARRKVTGIVRINSWGRTGFVRLRAGEVTDASFGQWHSDEALTELCKLRDGMFELSQRLPSVGHTAVGSSELLCDLEDAPLPELMGQCREKALTCEISVVTAGEPIELTYRAGELAAVDGAGDGTVADLNEIESGSVRIRALPLKQLDGRAGDREPARAGAKRPRRPRRRSNPPPVPAQLEAPPPLRDAQHSLSRVQYDFSAEEQDRTGTTGLHETDESAAKHRVESNDRPWGDHPRAWVDPSWVDRTRETHWTWTDSNSPAGVTRRIPLGNAMLGLGLICLTLLVGVMAAQL